MKKPKKQRKGAQHLPKIIDEPAQMSRKITPKSLKTIKPPRIISQAIQTSIALLTYLTLIQPGRANPPANTDDAKLIDDLVFNQKRFFIKGESQMTIDFYDYYFTNGLTQVDIKMNKGVSKYFKAEFRQPMNLYKQENSLKSFQLKDLNGMKLNYSKPLLETLFEAINFRIYHDGGNTWLESYIVQASDPNDFEGKTASFLKFTQIKFNMATKEFSSVTSENSEYYYCNNLASMFSTNYNYAMGRLMEVIYEQEYGHFKHCFLSRVGVPSPNKPEYFIFQLQSLKFVGFYEKGLPKNSILVSQIDPTIRKNGKDPFTFQSKAFLLKHYDTLVEDTIFYIINEEYFFYKQRIGEFEDEINGAWIRLPGHRIQEIRFLKNMFLMISTRMGPSNTPWLLIFHFHETRFDEGSGISYGEYEAESRGAAQGSKTPSGAQNGGQKPTEFHIFEQIRRCLERNQDNLFYCFVVIEENAELLTSDSMPYTGNLLLQIRIITPQEKRDQIQVRKWDPKVLQFKILMLVNSPTKYLYKMYNSLFFDVLLAQTVDPNQGNMTHHEVYVSDRSFLSIPRKQRVHSRKNFVVNYGSLNISADQRDELLTYFFLKTSDTLIRRGKNTIEVYTFNRPYALLQATGDLEVRGSMAPDTSECRIPYIFNFSMNSTYGGKFSGKVEICYVSDMRLGSSFPNYQGMKEVAALSLPTGYRKWIELEQFQYGSFLMTGEQGSFVNNNAPNSNQRVLATPQEAQTQLQTQNSLTQKNPKNGKNLRVLSTDSNKNDSKREELIRKRFTPVRKFQDSRKAIISMTTTKDQQISSVYSIMSYDEVGSLIVKTIISLPNQNILFQGSSPPRNNTIFLDSQKPLKDFRDIVGMESMKFNYIFVQIQDMSYYIKTNEPTKELQPWKGLNGICQNYVKIECPKIDSFIVCFYMNRFYAKFVNDQRETETAAVILDQDTLDFILLHAGGFLFLRSAKLAPGKFAYFYKDKKHVKLAFMQVRVANNKKTNFYLSLFSSVTLPRILDEDSYLYFSLSHLIDISISGLKIIVLAKKPQISDTSHVMILTFRGDFFTLKVVEEVQLPDQISFFEDSKISVTEISEKKDTIGNFFPSNYKFYIGVKVHFRKTDQKVNATLCLLTINLSKQILNSMTLIPMPEGELFLNYGVAYREIHFNRDKIFTFLTIGKKDLAKKMSEGISQTNYSIYFLSDFRFRMLFTARSKSPLQEIKEPHLVGYFNNSFSFEVTSKLFSAFEVFQYQAKYLNPLPARLPGMVQKNSIGGITFSKGSPVVRIDYQKWFKPFKNLTKNSTFETNITMDFLYQLNMTTHKYLPIEIDHKSTSISNDGVTRFIAIDIEEFSEGNVVNVEGESFSELEQRLGLISVPPNSLPETKNSKLCFNNSNQVLERIYVYCNASFANKSRELDGCKGRQIVNQTKIGNDDYHEVWVASGDFMKVFAESQCADANTWAFNTRREGLYSKIKLRSPPAYFGDLMFYFEGNSSNLHQSRIVVVDLSQRNYSDVLNQLSFMTYKSRFIRSFVDYEQCDLKVYPLGKNRDDFLVVLIQKDTETGVTMASQVRRVWFGMEKRKRASESDKTSDGAPSSGRGTSGSATLSSGSAQSGTEISGTKSRRVLTKSSRSSSRRALGWKIQPRKQIISSSSKSATGTPTNSNSQSQSSNNSSANPNPSNPKIDSSKPKVELTDFPIIEMDHFSFDLQCTGLLIKPGHFRLVFARHYKTLSRDHLIYFHTYDLHFTNISIQMVQLEGDSPPDNVSPGFGYIYEHDSGLMLGRFMKRTQANYFDHLHLVFEDFRDETFFDQKNDTVQLVISLSVSNDFLVKFPIEMLYLSVNGYVASQEIGQVTRNAEGVPLFFSYLVAPISNPFIGNEPSESPPAHIIDGYYFKVKNYQEESYLVAYKLDYSIMTEIKVKNLIIGSPYDFNNLGKFDNIMAVRGTNSTTYTKYICTRGIITLKTAPDVFSVTPHFNPSGATYHHLMIYADLWGNIYTKFFSLDLKIEVKTTELASNFIGTYIQGMNSQFVSLIFRPFRAKEASSTQSTAFFIFVSMMVFISLTVASVIAIISNEGIYIKRKRDKILQKTAFVSTMGTVLGKMVLKAQKVREKKRKAAAIRGDIELRVNAEGTDFDDVVRSEAALELDKPANKHEVFLSVIETNWKRARSNYPDGKRRRLSSMEESVSVTEEVGESDFHSGIENEDDYLESESSSVAVGKRNEVRNEGKELFLANFYLFLCFSIIEILLIFFSMICSVSVD